VAFSGAGRAPASCFLAFATGRSMNHRLRLMLSVLMIFCSCILASGCAMFQEPPKKINTVSEWMAQDRVKP
jgi:hypothetical protein